MIEILLGSKSPRRKQLLTACGIKFKTVNISSDENFSETMPKEEVAEYLALKKSLAYKGNLQGKVLITADTIVCIDDRIINKPIDENHAIVILNELSGKTHLVHTGVCIRTQNSKTTFTETSKVFFNKLSKEQIEFYVKKYKPLDKAGAYGIQDWIGLTGIGRIEGDYFNIMGLPVNKVYEILKKNKFIS